MIFWAIWLNFRFTRLKFLWSQVSTTCVGKIIQETCQVVYKKLCIHFFTFMVFYLNIDASLHMQVKNHHHHHEN
jgi:hypothetical protein